jgi:hypothetical protein
LALGGEGSEFNERLRHLSISLRMQAVADNRLLIDDQIDDIERGLLISQ